MPEPADGQDPGHLAPAWLDDSRLHRAAAHRAAERFEAALTELDALLVDQPVVPLQVLRAILLARLERGDEAAAELQRLLSQAPNHAAARALSARLGDDDEARARRREAARHLRVEAERLRHEADLDGALRRARAALALHPESAGLHELIGALCARLEQPDQALAALHQAVALQPDSATARRRIAQLGRRQELAREPELRFLRWRREAWQLAKQDWPGWLVLDGGFVTLIATVPLLLLAIPVVWLAGEAMAAEPLAWREIAGRGVVVIWLTALLSALWAYPTANLMLSIRGLIMLGKAWTGEFDVALMTAGVQLYKQRWWPQLIAWLAVGGLVLLCAGSLVLLPAAVYFAATLALLTPALALFGGRSPFLACEEAFDAARQDWGGWLAYLAFGIAVPKLLAGASLVLPIALVLRAWLYSGTASAVAGAGALALLLHLVLAGPAWIALHLAGLVWAVAYRDLFGENGLAAALAVAPELLGEDGRGDDS